MEEGEGPAPLPHTHKTALLSRTGYGGLLLVRFNLYMCIYVRGSVFLSNKIHARIEFSRFLGYMTPRIWQRWCLKCPQLARYCIWGLVWVGCIPWDPHFYSLKGGSMQVSSCWLACCCWTKARQNKQDQAKAIRGERDATSIQVCPPPLLHRAQE